MPFRVVMITGRDAKAIARNLEQALNEGERQQEQLVRMEKQGKSWLLVWYKEQVNFFDMLQQLAGRRGAPPPPPSPQVIEEQRERARIQQLCEHFLAAVQQLSVARTESEFKKVLPNAVLRALRQVGTQHAQDLCRGLEQIVKEHRDAGCKDADCKVELVYSHLKKHVSDTIC